MCGGCHRAPQGKPQAATITGAGKDVTDLLSSLPPPPFLFPSSLLPSSPPGQQRSSLLPPPALSRSLSGLLSNPWRLPKSSFCIAGFQTEDPVHARQVVDPHSQFTDSFLFILFYYYYFCCYCLCMSTGAPMSKACVRGRKTTLGAGSLLPPWALGIELRLVKTSALTC